MIISNMSWSCPYQEDRYTEYRPYVACSEPTSLRSCACKIIERKLKDNVLVFWYVWKRDGPLWQLSWKNVGKILRGNVYNRIHTATWIRCYEKLQERDYVSELIQKMQNLVSDYIHVIQISIPRFFECLISRLVDELEDWEPVIIVFMDHPSRHDFFHVITRSHWQVLEWFPYERDERPMVYFLTSYHVPLIYPNKKRKVIYEEAARRALEKITQYVKASLPYIARLIHMPKFWLVEHGSDKYHTLCGFCPSLDSNVWKNLRDLKQIVDL